MGQSSAGEEVREMLAKTCGVRHSPEVDKLIAYSKTPEYAEERAAEERANREAYEAKELARAEMLRARREAVAVCMSRSATLPYAVGGDHDKPSPVAVEAGDVVEVEAWQGDGWTAHVGGIGVFVPVRLATPCEGKSDHFSRDLSRAGTPRPAQAENGATESPMAGVSGGAGVVAQGTAESGGEAVTKRSRTPSEPRANPEQSARDGRSEQAVNRREKREEEARNKERTKSEPESPWGTRRLLSVMAATSEARCGGNETRVLLALTRFMAEGDETVWRSAEDVCSECRINDKSRKKAMEGLISKGLIQCARHSHRGNVAEYAVLFPWF